MMERLPSSSSPGDSAMDAPVMRKTTAMDLNSEAGRIPVPDDPREISAALRAGERSWERFPYYEMRYGERGRRFTRSDSNWIATLGRHAQTVVEKEVRWLGVVLASRGMPRWMLETHLFVLAEELERAAPESLAKYAPLLRAGELLADERRLHVSDERMVKLAAAFDERVGAEHAARLPETGALIAAAVADERCGIDQAVPSFVDWLTAEDRFDRPWIEAVRWAVAEGRGSSG